MQLLEKDKKIKELTKMVHMYETGQIKGVKGVKRSPGGSTIAEVMVINSNSPKTGTDEEIMNKYKEDIYKMSRADFLMS